MMDALPVGVKVIAPGIGKLQNDKKKTRKKEKQSQAVKDPDDE